MTLLYYSPTFQEHRTGNHPENGQRLDVAVRHLRWTGADALCRRPAWQAATTGELTRVHSPEFLHHLDLLCQRGGGWIEEDTLVSGRSYDVARLVAGAVCDAVRRVVAGPQRNAFAMVRPPGHHARPRATMGFCLLNHIAVAARVATEELGLDRVLIVDFDVHHGNGTQEVFWEDERVAFLSIHRWPFYPFTGEAGETGQGRGLGFTRNLPIRFGTPRSEYLSRLSTELSDFAHRTRPQLVLLSAGFDAHVDDPVGSLQLETEDFSRITEVALAVAREHAQGRLVSVLEGGYNPGALTDCIEVHLDSLLEAGGG